MSAPTASFSTCTEDSHGECLPHPSPQAWPGEGGAAPPGTPAARCVERPRGHSPPSAALDGAAWGPTASGVRCRLSGIRTLLIPPITQLIKETRGPTRPHARLPLTGRARRNATEAELWEDALSGTADRRQPGEPHRPLTNCHGAEAATRPSLTRRAVTRWRQKRTASLSEPIPTKDLIASHAQTDTGAGAGSHGTEGGRLAPDQSLRPRPAGTCSSWGRGVRQACTLQPWGHVLQPFTGERCERQGWTGWACAGPAGSTPQAWWAQARARSVRRPIGPPGCRGERRSGVCSWGSGMKGSVVSTAPG